MITRRLFAFLAALLLGLGLAAPPAVAAGQPGAWYDGAIKYSTITNCASIIYGTPYTEHGIDTYVGSWADPDDNFPKTNDSFPVHIVVSGPGRACDAQLFQLGLKLPSGVTIDASKAPECYYQGTRTTAPSECPTALQSGTYGAGTVGYKSGMSQYANGWPVPVGKIWEFRLWVKASQPVSGVELRAFVDIADGNSNPVLQPTSLMHVFSGSPAPGGTPQIIHDTISTYASPTYTLGSSTGNTKYGILSAGTLLTKGQQGTVYLQRGTSATNLNQTAGWAFNLNDPAFVFWNDWDEPEFSAIQPNTMYYWRLGFKPNGSTATAWGPTQSFRSLRQSTCDGKKITISLDLGQVPSAGPDVILGTAGKDTINAGDGDDSVCGGGDDDSISGGEGNDHLYGEGGNDLIDGGVGHDELDGGDGSDVLDGAEGNDFLLGANGDDTLVGGLGDDNIRGGPGTNTASYQSATSGVTVSLAGQADLTVQNTIGAGNDLLNGIQKLIGSPHDDTLTGSAANETIEGGDGRDTIDGGAGDDVLTGGVGVDKLSYATSAGGVTVELAKSTAQNTIGAGIDTVKGFENLDGSQHSDTLTGTAANEVLGGLGGNDVLDGGSGTDILNGGGGNDRVVFGSATAGVDVSLATTSGQQTVGAGTVSLHAVEGVDGTPHNDRLTGSAGADALRGFGGDDVIDGGGGDDTLDGGAGSDKVSYAAAASGVQVDLSLTTAQNTGGAGTDTVLGFEAIDGSPHSDTLAGSAGPDTIRGLGGHDILRGGAGNDVIEAGAGNDTIDGGPGTDLVSYLSATAGVRVSLATTAPQATGGSGTDSLISVENLNGSRFADSLVGSSVANVIRGYAGSDRITGGSGDDTLWGGSGNDTVNGDAGKDAVYGESGKNTLNGGSGNDKLYGGNSADRLSGAGGADYLSGSGGKDKLYGGAGVDRLNGGTARDLCDGGPARDRMTSCEVRRRR
ncbi:hypothetical protein ACLM5J_16780 [Nocardioides sp. Bht2]|uniref:hypothetical protein n=1 Tax=Nocardioides sp. Bht2 TaxID=3392297 RepID=UPI0039B5BC26